MPIGANIELANTFNDWRLRTNEIITDLNTVYLKTGGSPSTGNAAITGWWTANGFYAANGTSAIPSYSFGGQTNKGVYSSGNDELAIAIAAIKRYAFDANNFYLLNNTASIQLGTSQDVILLRDNAADTAALRRANNAQTLRLYNRYGDASNNEFVGIAWTANVFTLLTGQLGNGVARNMEIGTSGAANVTLASNGTNRWTVDSSGHLAALAAYNLTTTGTGTFTGIINAPTSALTWTGRLNVHSPADGQVRFSNTGGVGFTRLILGTANTTAGVSLEKNGVGIEIRLGDGSALTTLASANMSVTGNASISHTMIAANTSVSHTMNAANAAITHTITSSNGSFTHTLSAANAAVTHTTTSSNGSFTHTLTAANGSITNTLSAANAAISGTFTLNTNSLIANSTQFRANVAIRVDTADGRMVLPVGANKWAT